MSTAPSHVIPENARSFSTGPRPTPASIVNALSEGLRPAFHQATAARRRVAVAAVAGPVAWALPAAVLVLCVLPEGLPRAVTAIALAIAIVTWAVYVGRAARRHIPTRIEDLAERLDQSVPRHNAVATALELARSADPSPLTGLAVADGLAALEMARFAAVTLPPVRVRSGVVGTAVATAALVWLIGPHASGVPFHGTDGLTLRASNAAVASAHDAREPAAQPVPNSPASSVMSSPSDATAAGIAATPGGTAGANALNSPSNLGAAQGAENGGTHGGGSAPSSPATPAAWGTKNATDSTPTADHASTPVGQPAAQSAAAQSAAGSAAANGPSNAASSEEPSKASGGHSSDHAGAVDGSNGGDGGGKSEKESKSGGRGSDAGEGGGGRGQANGPSGAKKARGLAQTLLGIRQTDTIPGRLGPGPEERTITRLPPADGPAESAEAVALPSQSGVEPRVPADVIPPDQRALINDFFARWHAAAVWPVGTTEPHPGG